MSRWNRTVALGAMMVMSLSVIQPAGANLIVNSGFEDSEVGHHDVLEMGWDTWAGRNLSVTDAITGPVYEGDQALMFDKSTSNGGRELVQQIVGLDSDEMYIFSVQLNVQNLALKNNATNAGFHISVFDTDTGTLLDRHVQTTTTSGWQEIVLDITAPSSGAFTFVANVYEVTSALVYLDAVSLVLGDGGGVGGNATIPEPVILASLAIGGLAMVGRHFHSRA